MDMGGGLIRGLGYVSELRFAPRILALSHLESLAHSQHHGSDL